MARTDTRSVQLLPKTINYEKNRINTADILLHMQPEQCLWHRNPVTQTNSTPDKMAQAFRLIVEQCVSTPLIRNFSIYHVTAQSDRQ